jgi:hypothetical protein
MNRAAASVLTAASLLAASPGRLFAQSDDPWAASRFRFLVNGAFEPASLDYSEQRKFTEFVEESRIDAQYKDKAGPGFDLGLQFNFNRRVGVSASYSLVSRKGTGTYAADLPHPLYFNQFRKVSGNLSGLEYRENAGHLDLVGNLGSGKLGLAVFAGATLFSVQADLVDTIQYTHTYPYDAVTITGVPTKKVKDSPVGFNAGVRFDYKLGKTFGLGAQVRFSRATVKLVPTQGNSLDFEAGGLQAGAGLRVAF